MGEEHHENFCKDRRRNAHIAHRAGRGRSRLLYYRNGGYARLQAEKLTPAAEGYAVYDAADTFIAELSPRGGHKSVKGADLPAHVRDAFICAEDKNFYSHGGLDYKGIARAMLANLRARSFRQGGSTISQQLVKNTQLTSEKNAHTQTP